ncbi:phage Gp37/Gp68 family protein [Aquabacter sp. L1I39]|uniref:DUF5131 family protein n=1 Tax=Aquabacter sp. L1I39 TaxID=2820278 RepID=UPI001ADA9BA0|nr:DUF5131 family protein [Aquabacter sp. L1I39]QTL01948.1 phage Gp37/Gp68 family protein [Aquabacter sp. L1I39]
MSAASRIEWTDATWNPIVGCSLVSPGCTHCYAMKMAARIENIDAAERLRVFASHRHLDEMHPDGRDPVRTQMLEPRTHYAGTTGKVNGHTVWTGKVRRAPFNIMTQPLHWRRPRRIFVNSMGDLFHKDAFVGWIDLVFAIAAMCPQHEFQILTKRADEMRMYLADDRRDAWAEASWQLGEGHPLSPQQYADRTHFGEPGNKRSLFSQRVLPNVLVGVSVEDQRRADERRLCLADVAAMGWRTFVSYEPALGPVEWRGWEFLSWLISGGENGPRPSHPDWHRAARDYCAAHGIPYFFKQWGEWAPRRAAAKSDLFDARKTMIVRPDGITTSGLMAYDETAWVMDRVRKSSAGRLLDGIEHNGMPRIVTAAERHALEGI